jgi:TetR/AcrR family transcriptional repressor of nem operon
MDAIAKDKDHKGCLISNCTSEMANQEAQVTRFLNSNQDNMITLLEDLVSNAQKLGSISTKKSAHDYGLYLFSALQGFRTTGILLNDRKQLKSIVDIILGNLK